MTFGTIVADQELAHMAPIEQQLAKAFAAELGHTRPAEKPAPSERTENSINLSRSAPMDHRQHRCRRSAQGRQDPIRLPDCG